MSLAVPPVLAGLPPERLAVLQAPDSVEVLSLVPLSRYGCYFITHPILGKVELSGAEAVEALGWVLGAIRTVSPGADPRSPELGMIVRKGEALVSFLMCYASGQAQAYKTKHGGEAPLMSLTISDAGRAELDALLESHGVQRYSDDMPEGSWIQ